MCITEQTHTSVYLYIRLAQEQDIILVMLTRFINLLFLFY